MRLNLGCGNKKFEGFINIDFSPECKPDKVLDLNNLPYPFENSSIDEIKMFHLLEHLNNPLKVLEELHRIMKPNKTLHIKVPFWNYVTSHSNPQHINYFGNGWFEGYCKIYNLFMIKTIKYHPTFRWMPFSYYLSYFFGSIIKETETKMMSLKRIRTAVLKAPPKVGRGKNEA